VQSKQKHASFQDINIKEKLTKTEGEQTVSPESEESLQKEEMNN
jgi:hypothetical protein